jgi:two-component system response regulator YesN
MISDKKGGGLMYKALLVDDETLDLEGLKQLIPWEELDIEVIGTANSGFEAMDMLKEEYIDLLITDIKMPIMSGLELFDKARKLYPNLKGIFVSGYEDFQYAKKAIQMNASAYVLKPVDDEELISAIKGVVKSLDEEIEKISIEVHYKESIPYLRNELIHQLIEGNYNYNTLQSMIVRSGIKWTDRKLCAAVVEIDDFEWKLNNCKVEERAALQSSLINSLEDKLSTEALGYFSRIGKNRIILITNETDLDTIEKMDLFIKNYKGIEGVSLTCGVGGTVSTPEEIIHSYRQATEALDYKMFLGKNKVITVLHMRGEASEDASKLDKELEILFNGLSSYKLDIVEQSVENIFNFVSRLHKKIMVYNFIFHILLKLDVYLHSMNESLELFIGPKSKYSDELFKLETVEDIRIWLTDKVKVISEKLYSKRQKPTSRLIREIERYVEENMNDKLTLKDVANHFAFSPNYLGFVFKEGTSEAFSDFMIRKRLEKAKEMLQDPRLKIYEIADMVGYKNLTYFSRQFKDYFGITPGDYRKENKV